MPRTLALALPSLALLLVLSSAAHADPLVLNSAGQGWYTDAGANNGASNTNNYFVGASSGTVHRNYFVFDLSSVGGITSAQLRLFRPGNSVLDVDPSETYVLYAVQDPSVLGRQQGVDIFEDLGSGPVYATITLPTPTFFGSSFVIFDLNDEALAAIQSAQGTGLFAIGGAVTTLRQPLRPFSEGLFGQSGGVSAQLITNGQQLPVPEPATMILLATGLAGVAARVRKRRKA
jgi:hypothetical protein